MLLQGYEIDIKKKANIFDEAHLKLFMVEPMENNTYWEAHTATRPWPLSPSLAACALWSVSS
jgi:hypothetical protein